MTSLTGKWPTMREIINVANERPDDFKVAVEIVKLGIGFKNEGEVIRHSGSEGSAFALVDEKLNNMTDEDFQAILAHEGDDKAILRELLDRGIAIEIKSSKAQN